MKDLKIIISLFLTFISFFIGIFVGKFYYEGEVNKIKDEVKYLNLNIKKNKIEVESKSENLIITVNGDKTGKKEIDLDTICK